MGVPSLNQLLKECPAAVENVTNEELKEKFQGQTFLFDTSGMMHRFVNKCESIANNEHLGKGSRRDRPHPLKPPGLFLVDCFLKLWNHLRQLGKVAASAAF
jgi:hypothetical protein